MALSTEEVLAGLAVSLTENLDAMAALRHIPMEDREAFKYALAATLVKNNAHWRAFETVFEVYFSLRGAKYGIDDDTLDPDLADLLDDERDGVGEGGQGGQGQGGGQALTPEELQQLLYQAIGFCAIAPVREGLFCSMSPVLHAASGE